MTHLTSDIAHLVNLASRSPVLEREEELELARRVKEHGDRRAADLLVRAYLRMVIALAVKHRHYGLPVSDLVAEGNCGLVTALRKFDPERGIRFGTYAKHWVRAHMLAYVIHSSNGLAGATGFVAPKFFFKLRRERARVAAMLGDGAAADEALAERLNLSAEALRELLERLECRSVPLDASAPNEGPERTGEGLISNDNPEEHYFNDRRRDLATSFMALALEDLDARERFITENRLMVRDADGLSLSEIARAWGLSRERVRQLEERAKHKLERFATRRNSSVNEWFTE